MHQFSLCISLTDPYFSEFAKRFEDPLGHGRKAIILALDSTNVSNYLAFLLQYMCINLSFIGGSPKKEGPGASEVHVLQESPLQQIY